MSQTSEHPTPTADRPRPARDQADHGGWQRLVILIAAIAAGIVLSIQSGSFPAVAFVIALVFSVMLHEAGHFITAKWSGMKVTEFFFGFGPRLWSFRKGETEYGAKAIPAGGYVKIIGMSNLEKDIDPADEPRTYRQQSYPKRVMVAAAGIVTHFILAFIILMLVWTVVGVPQSDKPTLQIGSISGLEGGRSPAQDAGFRVGDRVVSVDGKPVASFRELTEYIRARPNTGLAVGVERDGAVRTLEVTTASVDREGTQVGYVGIGAKPAVEKVGPVTAVGRSADQLGDLTVASIKALGSFFSPSSLRDYGDVLTGSDDESENRPVSVVGVVRIADQAADQGLFDFLGILVLLNIFVAVFNMVPLLPLDGGHIAIATYERIRSRNGRRYQADVAKLLPLTAAVVVILIALGLSSVWLDITSPVGNPFQ